MKILSSVTAFILICLCSHSQIVDSLSTLELHLIDYQNSLLKADIEEYKQDKRYNLLQFVPSLGYDFLNHSPLITYNISNIGGYLKANKATNNKISSLTHKSEISLKNSLIMLKSKYNYSNMLFERLKNEIDIYNTYYQIFEISKKAYENNEIPIEDYLLKEIAIKERRQTLDNIKDRILLLLIDLEGFINHNINYIIPEY